MTLSSWNGLKKKKKTHTRARARAITPCDARTHTLAYTHILPKLSSPLRSPLFTPTLRKKSHWNLHTKLGITIILGICMAKGSQFGLTRLCTDCYPMPAAAWRVRVCVSVAAWTATTVLTRARALLTFGHGWWRQTRRRKQHIRARCDIKPFGWWWCRASSPRMSVDILGTNCDQCRSRTVQCCCFTSTETVMLVRTEIPGRPPRLSHSSWTLKPCGTNHGPM